MTRTLAENFTSISSRFQNIFTIGHDSLIYESINSFSSRSPEEDDLHRTRSLHGSRHLRACLCSCDPARRTTRLVAVFFSRHPVRRYDLVRYSRPLFSLDYERVAFQLGALVRAYRLRIVWPVVGVCYLCVDEPGFQRDWMK